MKRTPTITHSTRRPAYPTYTPVSTRPPALTMAPPPSIVWSGTAWAKAKALCALATGEVSFYCITSPTDRTQIEDVWVPKQTTTAASYETCGIDEAQQMGDLCFREPEPRVPENTIKIWCHTHPGNSATPSCTDWDTFEERFKDCEWGVMFILAKDGATSCHTSLVAGGKQYAIVTDVLIDWAKGSEKEAIEKVLADKVAPQSYTTTTFLTTGGSGGSQTPYAQGCQAARANTGCFATLVEMAAAAVLAFPGVGQAQAWGNGLLTTLSNTLIAARFREVTGCPSLPKARLALQDAIVEAAGAPEPLLLSDHYRDGVDEAVSDVSANLEMSPPDLAEYAARVCGLSGVEKFTSGYWGHMATVGFNAAGVRAFNGRSADEPTAFYVEGQTEEVNDVANGSSFDLATIQTYINDRPAMEQEEYLRGYFPFATTADICQQIAIGAAS